jgi:ribonucleotide reductase alpha subunit
MPTASSASILGNTEAFEPITQIIYARTVLSGQYMMVNSHVVKDLRAIDLWNTATVRSIISQRGSLTGVSEEGLDEKRLARLKFLKEKYLTAFELPQKTILDMALDRGRYVCQTQSLNCWMKDPDFRRLNAFHFYGWSRGAKTGMYYLHQMAGADPINFALESVNIPEKRKGVCTDEVCTMCSA